MKKVLMILAVSLIAVFILTGCTREQPENIEITMNGSTTVFPIAQRAAEVYMDAHLNVTISVEGTGSGNGIAALIDKTTDIANSSREIKAEEVDKAKANGVNPYETPIALDALSIVIHPSNPVNNLTQDQVKKIYTGEITNWKDVGGPDLYIVVVSRDSSSGTYEAFIELALGKDTKITDKALSQASNQVVKNTVATTEGAIGYIGLGYVDESVKAISFEGVTPNKENALNKTYPLSRYLYMYTNGEPTGAVKEFIDFVLGEEGQIIAEEVGFIRIK